MVTTSLALEALIFLKKTLYLQCTWKQLIPRWILLIICFTLWNGTSYHIPVQQLLQYYAMLAVLSYTSLALDNQLVYLGFEAMLSAAPLPLWSNRQAEEGLVGSKDEKKDMKEEKTD